MRIKLVVRIYIVYRFLMSRRMMKTTEVRNFPWPLKAGRHNPIVQHDDDTPFRSLTPAM